MYDKQKHMEMPNMPQRGKGLQKLDRTYEKTQWKKAKNEQPKKRRKNNPVLKITTNENNPFLQY